MKSVYGWLLRASGQFAPSRGRELKYYGFSCGLFHGPFAPSRGRELKLEIYLAQFHPRMFAPSRGRELKYRLRRYPRRNH